MREMLEEFFDVEEIPEILSFINSGPNTYEEYENTFGPENYTMLIPNKISNLTRKFGVMVDPSGNRIGYDTKREFEEIFARPSHWKYCMWKMKHNIFFLPWVTCFAVTESVTLITVMIKNGI